MNNKPVNFVTVGVAPLLDGNTNFIYQVENLQFESGAIDELNSLSVSDKIEYIHSKGGLLQFKTVEKKIFKNNLIFIESKLPQILAEIILFSYQYNSFKLPNLLDLLEDENPLNIPNLGHKKFYTYKIKEFMKHLLLGMKSNEVWHGDSDIYNHYPIVKDGDEIIYYTEDTNKLIDIVIKNSKLNPLKTKDSNIYFENEKYCLKLSLQLNFKNNLLRINP